MKINFTRDHSKVTSVIFKILLVTSIVIRTENSFCQIKDSISLSVRVKNLEDYKANIEQLYEISAAKLDTMVDAKIAAKVKDVDEAKSTLNLLLKLGIPTTILGLIGVYIAAVLKAKKIVFDKVEKVIEDKREEIIKLIETQEYDSRLRKSKKLLVLSPDEDSQERVKLFINKLKFNNVKYRLVDKYQKFEDYDLIIFNDHYTSFNQDLITEFITNIEEEHINFVAYTKNKLTPNYRLNFSNSPFTLYHNILSTLKYGEILKIQDT